MQSVPPHPHPIPLRQHQYTNIQSQQKPYIPSRGIPYQPYSNNIQIFSSVCTRCLDFDCPFAILLPNLPPLQRFANMISYNIMREENLNEVQSLVGKIDKAAMGTSTAKAKPKKAPAKTAPKSNPWELRGGNILEEKFDETLNYRPKTKDNKLVYENYLGRINEIVQDQPPETLLAIADEVLAIIKSDNEELRKRTDAEAIVGSKIKEDLFIDICNVVKQITDYDVQPEEALNEVVNLAEEDEQEAASEEDVVQEEEVEEEEEEQQEVRREKREVVDGEKVEKMEEEGVEPSTIDAHWIQQQLLNYYQPAEALRLQKQILSVLNGKAMQVENNLLAILNYEKFNLVSLLLRNRKVIYHCVRYHQALNDRDREHIMEEMKQDNISLAKRPKKTQNNEIPAYPQHEQQEDFTVRPAKDDEISRINKKIIQLTTHDSEDRTGSRQQYKFKLPEGAEKIERVGYEEVFIPARSKTINETLIQVDSLPSWMQPVFTGIKRFNPIQSRVLKHTLDSDHNMLVCAPTSAGKTNIALLAILRAISEYRDESSSTIDFSKFKVVYIAPMKALVTEIVGNLSNRLKTLGITVKELTGDTHLSKAQIEETQVIIATPEKWDIITRKTGEKLFVELVKLVIIDEIHLLSDSRGPVLESIIARTVRQVQTQQQQCRLVGLSATLPNYKDVGTVLRVPKEGLFYFDQSYRPIPLQQRFIGVTEKKGVRKMLMINEILYEKVMQRVGGSQMIIFVHSRRDTVRTANNIKETAFSKNELNRLIRPDSESKKIIEAIVEKETINSKDLKELLVNGIGVHHAGLSRGDRDLVEQLFADRHFNILVSTATLAWGVNLPAHTVIIKGTQVYSPEEGRWVELSLQDVMQMLGRAGRPRFDTEGEGIILTGYEEVRYYLNLLNMQIPLESQMLRSLPDQLNAEVVLGSVSSLREAVNWLTYTYLYIRMLKNPKHYSIPSDEVEQDKQLLRRRVNLAHSALTLLQRNGLVSYDRRSGAVSANFLGRIASFYYIKYPSMSIYNSNLKASSGLIELLRIFSMSIEFKYLAVREEEKNELKKLVETVPVPIKGAVEDITTKIAALLQAHISRLTLEGLALNVDKVYVTQSASRIMRAIFEICLKRGWGQAAQRALELAKMVDKSMWTCLNPLRQFRNIPEYVLSRLEKKEQFSWQSFYQMTPQQIGELTKFPKLGKILHKFVHHVPRVQIEAYAQPLTRSCLQVDLTATADFKWEGEHHGREQPFWLMVLDCNEETVLYSYYFTLSSESLSFSTQFVVPLFEVMHPLYYIKVVSDRWVCADNVLPLSFKSMLLPSKFAPPTELLDLQPLPAGSLDPIAKELRIGHLNQVQTQAARAFLDSSQNVFLGASEGSGKFTLALLAISQVLQAGKKAVLIVSHTAIAEKKTLMLRKLLGRKQVGRTFEDLTKDAQILARCDLIVTTAQAWDVLSRRWKSRKGFSQIGLIVVDNLHLLSENSAALQVVVSRMRLIASQKPDSLRLICLSCSLADYREVAEWMGASPENTFNFHPSVRPNSVQVVFNSYEQPIRESRLHMMQKNLMQNVLHYNRSTLVVVSDKKQARITALDLVSELAAEAAPKRLKKINERQMEAFAKRISDQYLLHIIDYGIGYIYEGMNEFEREIVEELFKVEGITVLVITQALKWEIDYKVFMVAVLDCNKYDPRAARWNDYSIPDMAQLMGLAAISEKDRHKGKEYASAKFIVYCQAAKKHYYKKFLFEPYPLESSLHLHLHNHFNAAVVAKNVSSKAEGVDWLTWTFMYRRLTSNPNFYNMDDTSENSVSLYLSDLVDETAEYLAGIKCVEADEEEEDALAPTNLGIICSYYYVKVETLAAYLNRTTDSLKLRDVLEVITQAEELADCQYRPKEYDLIAQLLASVSEKPINKAHGLLLLHLHRVQVPSELLQEIRSLLPLCVRLTHALVDVVSSLGYLKPLIFTMQFCQMLVQAMWINDSPLLQILDRPSAQLLQEHYNVKDIAEFTEMEDEDRRKVLKGKDIDRIAAACNRYPVLTLTHAFGEATDEEVQLLVTLEREEELGEDYLVGSRFFPGEKEEFWWVIVGDKKTNKVISTKRTLVGKQAEVQLQVELADCSRVVVYALCDSYVGCDQAEEIDLPN